MSNLPQNFLLRELGGCISYPPTKLRVKHDKSKLDKESVQNSNITHDGLSKTESNDTKAVVPNPSHPRINTNIVRHSYRIFKHLISSDNREFRPLDQHPNVVTSSKLKHPIVSEGVALGVTYADGKIFIRNKVDKTYDCYAVREDNKKLYSLSQHPKWEDVAIVAHSTPNELSKPIIIILRKGNIIDIHDLDTGNPITKIHLGAAKNDCNVPDMTSPSRWARQDTRDQKSITFKELYFDFETSQICVKSTRNPRTNLQSNKCDILVTFVLFSYPDMKHKTTVNIRRSVFGPNITDAEISQDIVMVMESGSVTRLYSLQSVIDSELKNTQNNGKNLIKAMHSTMFYQYHMKDQDDFNSIPTNIIYEKPPCLYVIKSFQHNVQLSPISGMKTIITGLNDHNFKLLNLKDNSLVINGMVGMRDPEGINHVRFHPDDSSRVLYLHPPHLSVYEIQDMRNRDKHVTTELDSYKLHRTFDFHVLETNQNMTYSNSALHNSTNKDCYRFVSDRDIINFHSIKLKENILESHGSQTECNECGVPYRPTPNIFSDSTQLSSSTTKSGRKVVQRIPTLAYDDLVQKRNYVTYDYEDELDILVLLTYNDFNETFPGRDDDEDFIDTQFSVLENVILLDNTTYQVIKRVPINEVLKDNRFYDVSVTLDRDILLIKVHSGNQTKSFLYKLCSTFRNYPNIILN